MGCSKYETERKKLNYKTVLQNEWHQLWSPEKMQGRNDKMRVL